MPRSSLGRAHVSDPAVPRSTCFQRFILPGFAFKAVVIGGGYSTGRELATFFLPSGPRGGLYGMLLSMAIWSVVCALTFLFALQTRSLDYRTFFQHLLGRLWPAFEVLLALALVVILAVYAAAAGAIGHALLGWPLLAGSVLLVVCVALIAAFGNVAVEKLFKYVTYFLYTTYALFVFLSLTHFGPHIVMAFEAPTATTGWSTGGLMYAGYNITGAILILPVVRHMSSRRDAIIAGLLAGPMAMLPAILVFICMVGVYPQVIDEPLPSDYLLAKLNIPRIPIDFPGHDLCGAPGERDGRNTRYQRACCPRIPRGARPDAVWYGAACHRVRRSDRRSVRRYAVRARGSYCERLSLAGTRHLDGLRPAFDHLWPMAHRPSSWPRRRADRTASDLPTSTIPGRAAMSSDSSRAITIWLLAFAGTLVAASAGAVDIVVHAGRLIDGVAKVERTQVSILIHDDRITGVEDGFVSGPAGARVVDLADKTVLPGLIDCHDHITSTWRSGDTVRDLFTRSDEDDAIEATVSARNTLLAGFTSIRDVGASTRVVVALKRAVSSGVIEGPRMWVAGPVLGPTGGHGDEAGGLNPEVRNPHWLESIVDGPEEARRTVRRLRREGVDLIKIAPSGGVLSIGDDPSLQLMQDDEIKAVVETAHSLGMKVAAHAHGKQAIDHSIILGVDSIEHGSYADQASYVLMKAHGVFLVPTLLIGVEGLKRVDSAHPEEFDPSTIQKGHIIVPMLSKNLHNAYKAGVKIAFGTDTLGLLQARRQCAGVCPDGGRRHVANRCHLGSDSQRRRIDRSTGRHWGGHCGPLRRPHRSSRRPTARHPCTRTGRLCHAGRPHRQGGWQAAIANAFYASLLLEFLEFVYCVLILAIQFK